MFHPLPSQVFPAAIASWPFDRRCAVGGQAPGCSEDGSCEDCYAKRLGEESEEKQDFGVSSRQNESG